MSNSYLQFDGSTGSITVPNDPALNFGTGNFSICFWAQPIDYGFPHIVFRKGTPDDFPAFDFLINDGGGKAEFYYSDDAAENFIAVETSNSGFTDQLHHFAVVRNGNDLSIFVDGNDVTVVTDQLGLPGTVSVTNMSDLIFADNYDSKVYKGFLDDFRIYKKALTPNEIGAIYNNGKGTQYTGAVAEGGAAAAAWDLDEGAGSSIIDAVGGLEGTLSGGVTWLTGGVPLTAKTPSHIRRLMR